MSGDSSNSDRLKLVISVNRNVDSKLTSYIHVLGYSLAWNS